MAKETDITRRVYRYYWDHPGMNYHYKDVADSFGMGTNEEISAVNAALTRAESRHPEYGIRRVGAGTYRFNPVEGQPDTPVKDTKLYEFIGFMSDDVLVVRDDEGQITLWRKAEIQQ
jgi:hypothetical protein